MNQVRKAKWETCDSLDPFSWGYNRNLKEGDYMTPNQVVDYLVDVVSKNGNLLINIGPRADGTIPEVMQSCLRHVGEWLHVNGEAIYGSHYWEPYKDGDVRFTRKGNTLYMHVHFWPGETVALGGLTNKKIGANIGLSESSVKAIVQRLFAKASVRTRSQLVRVALEGSLGAAAQHLHRQSNHVNARHASPQEAVRQS
jgi:alpha-L-fucosidase